MVSGEIAQLLNPLKFCEFEILLLWNRKDRRKNQQYGILPLLNIVT
jgi:hypothetical protein